MPDPSFPEDTLENNLRCKVIYYSCVNPSTIADLNQAWGYSPTYLYQESTIDRMEEEGMITVEEDGGKNIIQSNYDLLFAEDNVEKGLENVNRKILEEFLIHSKGFHAERSEERDREDLLNIARGNLDDELENNLQELEFSWDDYHKLLSLWRNDLFRETFFSLDILTALFGDRKDEMPSNPLNHLFRLTSGLVTAIARARGEQGVMIPPGLTYRAETVVVPAHRNLEREREDGGHGDFASMMNDTYSLYRTKFREDRFNHDFLRDFSELAMRKEGDRKFSRMFKNYRGSGTFNPFS